MSDINNPLEKALLKPNTVTTTVRLDVRVIANLLEYCEGLKFFPRNKSDLIKSTLGFFSDMIIKGGKVKAHTMTDESLEFLHSRNMDFSRRNLRNLTTQISKEEKEAEFFQDGIEGALKNMEGEKGGEEV